MNCPEAVRKHDGRVVAFDSAKLAGSVARAAIASANEISPDSAMRLGHEISLAVGAFLLSEIRHVPASADIRASAINVLRATNHDAIADAYAEEARTASSLLWRIRVVTPGTPFTGNAGSPWDRRRLLESLRASGIARDPAGEVAREVERRIVALNQDRISPALIHALAVMVLAQRALEIKSYGARRVAYSLSVHVPHFDSNAAEQSPLPRNGPALESFWLQAVHSNEVVRAVNDNLLSLEPYPYSPKDDSGATGPSSLSNPLRPEIGTALRNWCAEPGQSLWVHGEGPERAAELARYLALLPQWLVPEASSGAAINVLLVPAKNKVPRVSERTSPVTINLAGLIIREALRDLSRATVRLAQTVSLAAQAHREREEYFSYSPVRGRSLPIAVAGLWNAAAWMQGDSFDFPRATRGSRTLAGTLVAVLQGSVDTMRNETGMELVLAGTAPGAAVRHLWGKDREFLLRDGITLDANAVYDGGPAVKLWYSAEDFGERLDFAKAVGSAFNEPPAVSIEVPLGAETDLIAWRELIIAFAHAGVHRLQLLPGGSPRAMRNLVRSIRTHLEGFPLFEQNR